MIAFLKMQDSHLFVYFIFWFDKFKTVKKFSKREIRSLAYILNSLGLLVLDKTFA